MIFMKSQNPPMYAYSDQFIFFDKNNIFRKKYTYLFLELLWKCFFFNICLQKNC